MRADAVSPEEAGSRWAAQVGSSSPQCPGPPRGLQPPQSHPAARPDWWSAGPSRGSPGRDAAWLQMDITSASGRLRYLYNALKHHPNFLEFYTIRQQELQNDKSRLLDWGQRNSNQKKMKSETPQEMWRLVIYYLFHASVLTRESLSCNETAVLLVFCKCNKWKDS